jgi:hypothetical protein
MVSLDVQKHNSFDGFTSDDKDALVDAVRELKDEYGDEFDVRALIGTAEKIPYEDDGTIVVYWNPAEPEGSENLLETGVGLLFDDEPEEEPEPEPEPEPDQCVETAKSTGEQCQNTAMDDSEYCGVHAPKDDEEPVEDDSFYLVETTLGLEPMEDGEFLSIDLEDYTEWRSDMPRHAEERPFQATRSDYDGNKRTDTTVALVDIASQDGAYVQMMQENFKETSDGSWAAQGVHFGADRSVESFDEAEEALLNALEMTPHEWMEDADYNLSGTPINSSVKFWTTPSKEPEPVDDSVEYEGLEWLDDVYELVEKGKNAPTDWLSGSAVRQSVEGIKKYMGEIRSLDETDLYATGAKVVLVGDIDSSSHDFGREYEVIMRDDGQVKLLKLSARDGSQLKVNGSNLFVFDDDDVEGGVYTHFGDYPLFVPAESYRDEYEASQSSKGRL